MMSSSTKIGAKPSCHDTGDFGFRISETAAYGLLKLSAWFAVHEWVS